MDADGAAVRGEFHRVRQQIERDLFDGASVGMEHDTGGDIGIEREPLFAGAAVDDPQAVGKNLVELDRLGIEVDAAGLDLRHVEDVVDDVEQILAAGADIA